MARSTEYPDLEFWPPAAYSGGRPLGGPRFIVVHYTAGSEGGQAAENGAGYDQRRTDGTSAHYHVDSNSVVQCVFTWDRAHTALYHGNAWGIQYELAGTRQTRAQWLDPVSRETIRNAARQMARDMRRYGIPNVKTKDVRNPQARGITGHVDWTYGWPEDGGDHTDPGPEFPYDVLQADIAGFLAGGSGGDDMSQASDNFLRALSEGMPNYDAGGGRMAPVGPVHWKLQHDARFNQLDGNVKRLTEKIDALAARPDVDVDSAALAGALAANQVFMDKLADALAARLGARIANG